MNAETLDFGADVSRLLDIVTNALYTNKDIFLRELISNSADACDKLRYKAITQPDLIKNDPEYRVRITLDTENRTLTVADNGIGMNRQELIDNLGTIAKSGTRNMMDSLKNSKDEKDRLSLIGQFGVGFYASFMVTDKAVVVSRKAGEDQAWYWESDGRNCFAIRKAAGEENQSLISDRGTAVILKIRNDDWPHLIADKIKEIVRTYSDHVDIPIYLKTETNKEEEEKEPINRAAAVWTRPKSEITEEQYEEFFRHISHGMMVDNPVLTSHWKAEGVIEYTALLFIPSMRPWDLYDPSRKHAVRLYVKRVFITDQCDGLVYPWLRFLRGVIDSADLPLNISREMLQHNPVIAKIKKGVAKRILGDLEKLSKEDEPAFKTFWGQFGAVLKEGLYDASDLRADLFKVCRFRSSHDNGENLISLQSYISRMKDGQDEIYYISGEKLDTLANSPQLEGFRARGLDVLLLTDTIDDFWIQQVQDFEGKKFRSITKGDIDFSRFENTDPPGANEQETEDQNKKDSLEKEPNEKIKSLIEKLAVILKEDVGTVRLSRRLTESPVCLIAGENEADLHMEQVLRIQQKYDPVSKRILEINGDHPLVTKMAESFGNDVAGGDDLHEAAYLLLDQARIIQGDPVSDPARFARSMSRFMERGMQATKS